MDIPYRESKRKWFSLLNASKENSLLRYYKTIPTDALVVCKQGEEYRSYSLFFPLHTFIREILSAPPLERSFYEVILGEHPQKPYFDIDVDRILSEKEISDLLNSLSESLRKSDSRIEEKNILYFSSHGPNKMSFHVVVNNWCLPDVDSNRFFCEKVINNIPSSLSTKKYIDSLVYKSVQQFRTFGSTKYGQDRNKILIGNLSDNISRKDFFQILLSSLITNTSSCRILGYEVLPKKIWDLSSSPDLSLEEQKIIEDLPILQTGVFTLTEIKNRLIVLKRLLPSECSVCDRIHENENPFLTFSPCGRYVYFNCRRSKGKVIIYEKTTQKEEGRFLLRKYLGKDKSDSPL